MAKLRGPTTVGGEFSRLPYTGIEQNPFENFEVRNLAVDLYAPGIVVVRLDARAQLPWQGDLSQILGALSKVRIAEDVPAIRVAIAATYRAFLGLSGDQQSPKRVRRFAVDIGLPAQAGDINRLAASHGRELIAFHVGSNKVADLGASLIESVQESNRALNMKSVRDFSVVNEQGFSYLHSIADPEGGLPRRFLRTSDLLEIASVLQEGLFDQSARSIEEPGQFAEMLKLANRWVRYSGNVLATSVSNRVVWDAMSDSLHLSGLVNEWSESWSAH